MNSGCFPLNHYNMLEPRERKTHPEPNFALPTMLILADLQSFYPLGTARVLHTATIVVVILNQHEICFCFSMFPMVNHGWFGNLGHGKSF